MQKIVVRIVVILVGMYGLFTVGRILTQFHLFDFAIYYQAVMDLKRGLSMYLDPTIAMKYPMSGMLVLYPIGWLPYAIVEKLWTLWSLTCLGLSLWWMGKLVPRLSKFDWVLIGCGIILSFPYKFTLGMGQINLQILALLTGALYFYQRGREGVAGTMLAIAAWIKITPLLLLLYFWRKRAYKTIVATIGVYILGWILAGALWGFDLVSYFWREVVPSISMTGNFVYYNQGLTGILARSGVVDTAAQIINYLVLSVMMILSYWVTPINRVGDADEMIAYGLFVACMLIGAGLAWQHYFVWTIYLFIGIWAKLKTRDKQVKYMTVVLLVSYALVAMNVKNPQDFSGFVQLILSHMTVGTLLLWGLGVRLMTAKELQGS